MIAVFDVPTFQATVETDPLVFFMLVLILSAHKRSRGGQGLCYTHILAHQVILCFEKRYPKQNTAAGVTSKIVPPQKKIFGCLPHCVSVTSAGFSGLYLLTGITYSRDGVS